MKIVVVSLGAALVLAGVARGQAGQGAANVSTLAPAAATAESAAGTPAAPDTYVIGRDDVLSVTVQGMADMSTTVRVDSGGKFVLPLLSQPVQAAGLTAPDVAAALAQSLQSQGLAVRPQVRVTVTQVLSKPVVVAGAVRTPMVLQAARPLSLLESLARAGGVTESGGQVSISKASTEHSYDLNAVLNGDSTVPVPELLGGEMIRVLPARLIYAVGAFQKPGAFPLQTGEPLTVLRAVALAQGYSSTDPADKAHAEIVRTRPDGTRTTIPVDLNRVLQHKAADVELQSGDILYLPDSGRQKFLKALMQDVGQSAVIAIGYGIH